MNLFSFQKNETDNLPSFCSGFITREYPIEYQPGLFEPYYPVNDEKNNRLCSKYQKLANMEKNVLFGGRLADYKYYNMDEVIEKSLSLRFS